jgi:hypothetical protein
MGTHDVKSSDQELAGYGPIILFGKGAAMGWDAF